MRRQSGNATARPSGQLGARQSLAWARRKWSLAIILMVVISLLMTACATGQPSPTQAPAPTAAGQPGATTPQSAAPTAASQPAPTQAAKPSTGGTYKLMVIGPFTASPTLPSPFPELLVGAKAAAAAVNDAGGVNGRTIEIVGCDTKADPNAATSCAQQAVKEGIPAVVGAFDLRGDYLTVLEANAIPVIAPFGREVEVACPIAYPVAQALTLLPGELSLLANLGAKSISFVYSDAGEAGQEQQMLYDAVIASHPGLQVTGVPVSQNTPDLSATVALANKTDGMGTALQGAQLVSYLNGYMKLTGGKKPVSADMNSMNQEIIDQMGALVEGFNAPGIFLPSTTPGNPAVDEFNKYMAKIDKSASTADFAMTAYVGVKIFAAAVKGQDNVTGQSVIDSLNKISELDLGLLPPVSFQNPSTVLGPKVTRIFNTGVVYAKVVNGRWVPAEIKFYDAFTGKPMAK